MKVWEILQQKGSDVITIGPKAAISEAVEVLTRQGIAALVVVDDDSKEILGIITERDVLRRHVKEGGCDPSVRVDKYMTKDLFIGLPEDDTEYVMGIMTQNHIRHLPILKGRQLAGIISIGDVVKSQLKAAEFENRILRDYIRGTY